MTLISQAGTEDRAELHCRVVYDGRQKDFLGFRRASNAVIEATILATRMKLHDAKTMAEWFSHYARIVDKTGDEIENQAFQMVHDYVRRGM
jgi:hypothetical protein